MGRTATQLGSEFGKSAREMNKLLLAHGLMEEAMPGAYRPTELGEQFATAIDHDNGYGGHAHRQWGWLTWDDGVVDALKASIEANPDGVVQPAAEAAPAATPAVSKTSQRARHTPSLTNGQWIGVGVAVVVGLASTPPARRVWREKVMPTAARLRTRLSRRTTDSAEDGEHGLGPETTEA